MQKNYVFPIVIVFFMYCTISYSQTRLEDFLIKFEIENNSSIDSQALGFLIGTTLDMYFSKKQQKVDFKTFNGQVNVQTIFNQENIKNNTLLVNMMGEKFQVSNLESDLFDLLVSFVTEKEELKIIHYKTDKKSILGFKTHRVDLNIKDDLKIILYVTNEILPNYNINLFNKIQGFPLRITMVSNNASEELSLVAKEIEPNVSKEIFTIPYGYKKMTKEEFEKEVGIKLGN